MIRGMHHISLATADMDRFVAFYRDLLGVQLDRVSSIPDGFEPFENIVVMRATCGEVAQFQLGHMPLDVFRDEQPQPEAGARPPAISDVIPQLALGRLNSRHAPARTHADRAGTDVPTTI